jgi:hypothetical protein
MKLERINAAAQTELPNARPLSRSQSVSKISAPIPDKKRMAERIITDAVARRLRDCDRYDACVVWGLLTIALGVDEIRKVDALLSHVQFFEFEHDASVTESQPIGN